MLTMFVGFVLICSGVDKATGQQQGLNEQSQQNGKKLEIREVSQPDKLTEVQEIPVTDTQIAEEIEATTPAENPLQQRKVELKRVMEDQVASLVKLIEQDKKQADQKQTDQQGELQKRMEEIQKELGQMFLEYLALSEKLAEQTDPKTAQKDEEFMGRILKLHKEANVVTSPIVAQAGDNIVKYYVSGDDVKDVKVDEKSGQVVYRIKTADGEEKVWSAKELGDLKLVDEIQISAELKNIEELKEVEELKKIYEVMKTEDLQKAQELKMVYEIKKAEELAKTKDIEKVLELKKVEELKGKPIQLKVTGGDAKGVVLSTKGDEKAYEVYISGDKDKAVALKKLDELLLTKEAKYLQIVKEKAGSGKNFEIVTEAFKSGGSGGHVVLKKLDEETELQEYIGITSPIKFHAEKKMEGDKEVSYMIILSGDTPPKEVTRVVQPVQMRNWKADDGTTSIVIGPAKKQIKDETETEVEFKAGTIILDRLKKDEAQSNIGRTYAIAVDAAQARNTQEKLIGELQIVTREKQQEAKKKAELEKKLAQLKAELVAINRQVEKKDTQVRLELEMKELENVLSRINKSNTASGQALQNYIAVGRTAQGTLNNALVDLRKEQNQLKILVDEAKISGDQKKAAELEKMIELFIVREEQAKDQAKSQADQAQRQYRVATTRAGNVAQEKLAQANTVAARNLADAALISRTYSTPINTTSSRTQKNDALVIPSGKTMDADEYKIAVENMQTMALILKKKLDLDSPSGAYGIWSSNQNQILNLAGSDDIQTIYLQGYGALFLMTVDYPLLAPVEKKVEPKEKAGDDVWEKARQEIKSGKQGIFSIAQDKFLLSTSEKSAQKYNQEKVENLKQTLLESLRHAGNMGHVDDSEWITIHVTGADQPIIEVITEIKSDSEVDEIVVGLSISGDVKVDSKNDQTFMVTKSEPQKGNFEIINLNPNQTSEPTYMLIQAQKRDIDRFADDRITLEEFIEEVTVLVF